MRLKSEIIELRIGKGIVFGNDEVQCLVIGVSGLQGKDEIIGRDEVLEIGGQIVEGLFVWILKLR